MKGTFFKKPLELRLLVEGESWRQGDPVSGELSVRNTGSESFPSEGLCVRLARGELRKVRAKSPDAFQEIASAAFGPSSALEAGKESVMKWSFPTDRNCQITDSLASLFLLYGNGEDSTQIGQLQLKFDPDEVIQEFIQRLQVNFRFVAQSRKSRKGWVEYKLDPPSAKAYATLEQLALSFRFHGEALEVRYVFQVKKIESTAAALDLKKGTLELAQTFTPSQYRLPSGRINHDLMESSLKEALGQVEARIVY